MTGQELAQVDLAPVATEADGVLSEAQTTEAWRSALALGMASPLLRAVDKAGDSTPDADIDALLVAGAAADRSAAQSRAEAAVAAHLLFDRCNVKGVRIAEAYGRSPGLISQYVTEGRVYAVTGMPDAWPAVEGAPAVTAAKVAALTQGKGKRHLGELLAGKVVDPEGNLIKTDDIDAVRTHIRAMITPKSAASPTGGAGTPRSAAGQSTASNAPSTGRDETVRDITTPEAKVAAMAAFTDAIMVLDACLALPTENPAYLSGTDAEAIRTAYGTIGALIKARAELAPAEAAARHAEATAAINAAAEAKRAEAEAKAQAKAEADAEAAARKAEAAARKAEAARKAKAARDKAKAEAAAKAEAEAQAS